MPLVDSHCHLDRIKLSEPFTHINEQIAHTQKEGVQWMLNISIDQTNWDNVLKIAQDNKDVFASIGVHPDSKDTATVQIEEIITAAKDPNVIAIGETGLDYFHDDIPHLDQQNSFRKHIQAAIQTQLPLIIHTRAAREDTLAILKEESAEKVGGIMHCFTESLEMAQEALRLGFYISISGIVTFKNAEELRAVAKAIPLDKLLIETDSPYLAPVPHRGKPNQPAYVLYVAEKLAEVKGISTEEVIEATTANFFKLFESPLRE